MTSKAMSQRVERRLVGLLMHSSEGRCYSTREMAQYLTDAGFRDASYRDTAAARGIMTATK